MNFELLEPAHLDRVTDVVFDYYGKRFATCSSDKHVMVWTMDEATRKWSSDYLQQRAHNDIVNRLSWAHPEFGQLIASCSDDNTVRVWEEQDPVGDGHSSSKWVRRAMLSHSSQPVKDVKFSHHGLGLMFAAASADGNVRIYEARDVFDLTSWDLKIQYQVEDTIRLGQETSSEYGLTSVAWNQCPFEPGLLAVGGGSKKVYIYSVAESTLHQECTLPHDQEKPISDIAWAPAMGRSYHLIAVANRDSTFKIYTLKRKDVGSLDSESITSVTLRSSSNSPVWRLTWNATGTLLASSSDDGKISLWRKDVAGNWANVQNIPS